MGYSSLVGALADFNVDLLVVRKRVPEPCQETTQRYSDDGKTPDDNDKDDNVFDPHNTGVGLHTLEPSHRGNHGDND